MYNVTIWYADRQHTFTVYADSIMDAVKIGERRACRVFCKVLSIEAVPVTVQISDAKRVVDRQLGA